MKLLLALLFFAVSAFAQTGGQGVGAPCQGNPLPAIANVTAAGTTLVIPAAPTNQLEQTIRVCSVDIVSGGGGASINFKLVGTIGGVDTPITPLYNGIATYAKDWNGQISAAPRASLGINLAATSTPSTAVLITYYYSIK